MKKEKWEIMLAKCRELSVFTGENVYQDTLDEMESKIIELENYIEELKKETYLFMTGGR